MKLLGALAMAVFLLACLAVALRLALLARRTRQLPEAAISAGFLLIGGVGYTLTFVARWSQTHAPAGFPWLWGGSLAAINLGVLAIALSTWRIFRPYGWGRTLWTGLAMAMAASWVGQGWTGSFERMEIAGVWGWLGLCARLVVFPWTAFEALRYAARVRRQLRLGLGDREVLVRCTGWGIAALATSGIFLRSAVSALRGTFDPTAPGAMAVNIVLGLVAAAAVLRAFLWRGPAGRAVHSPGR